MPGCLGSDICGVCPACLRVFSDISVLCHCMPVTLVITSDGQKCLSKPPSVSWVQDHIWLRVTNLDKELGTGQYFCTKSILEMSCLCSGYKVYFPCAVSLKQIRGLQAVLCSGPPSTTQSESHLAMQFLHTQLCCIPVKHAIQFRYRQTLRLLGSPESPGTSRKQARSTQSQPLCLL